MKSALSQQGRRTTTPPISWLMKAALTRPKLISLAAGFTDNITLPNRVSQRLLDGILRSPATGRVALQYGITAGDAELRRLTATHLQKLDGGHDHAHSPDRVIITTGSQQLLYMTLEALCDQDDIILVEDPTYFVFLSILQSRGIQARGVKLECDGIDLAHLEAVLTRLQKSGELARVKGLYLVTYFQNPTGATTTLERKRAALALLKKFERAAGHPLYLIEDAAYRELRFDQGADVPTALTLPGARDRVIYTGTYSKPYAPGARLGFGILPEPIFSTVQNIKGNHDFGSPGLLQALLARALASGEFDRQVRRVQKRYARKARIMQAAITEHFPTSVEIWAPGGGLYFWARLPKGISAGVKSRLFQLALKRDVLYVPGELCYTEDPTRRRPANELRISYGNASEDNIRLGIARLGRVFRDLGLKDVAPKKK